MTCAYTEENLTSTLPPPFLSPVTETEEHLLMHTTRLVQSDLISSRRMNTTHSNGQISNLKLETSVKKLTILLYVCHRTHTHSVQSDLSSPHQMHITYLGGQIAALELETSTKKLTILLRYVCSPDA